MYKAALGHSFFISFVSGEKQFPWGLRGGFERLGVSPALAPWPAAEGALRAIEAPEFPGVFLFIKK